MEAQEPLAQVWGIVALVILLPLCVVLFFKMMTAKTRKAHWGYFALAMFLGTVLFSVLGASGLMPSTEQLRQHQAEAPPPQEVLSQVPTSAFVTFALMALIWIGGGNWVMISARRRAGRSWWDCFNPFNPPFRDMDRKAWLQLAVCAVLSFIVLSVGLGFIESPGENAVPPAN